MYLGYILKSIIYPDQKNGKKEQSWKISIMEMKQSTQKYEEEITPIKYI